MYGNAWNPLDYFGNCSIAVLNLDSSGLVGGALSAALGRVASVSGYGFNVHLLDAARVTASSVADDVERGKFWGALVIRNGTGAALSAALAAPSAAFDNAGYLTFVLDQGKAGSYIYLAVRIWATALVSIMSSAVASAVLAAQTSVLGALNSQVLSNPIGVVIQNLHPVDIPGLDVVCSFTPVFIYFSIIGHVSIALKAHAPLRDLNVGYRQRLVALCLHVCGGAALYAALPVCTVMWLGHELGPGPFFALWAFMWLAMCSFASMFLVSYHVFGESAGAMINITVYTVGSASGGVSIPHDLQNNFFQIGKALPFYNIVQGLRHILFGSGQSIGVNVGVLLIWTCGSFALAWELAARRELARRLLSPSKPKPTQTSMV